MDPPLLLFRFKISVVLEMLMYSAFVPGIVVTCDGKGTQRAITKDMFPDNAVYLSLTNFKFDTLVRNNFTHLSKVQCLATTNSGNSFS